MEGYNPDNDIIEEDEEEVFNLEEVEDESENLQEEDEDEE